MPNLKSFRKSIGTLFKLVIKMIITNYWCELQLIPVIGKTGNIEIKIFNCNAVLFCNRNKVVFYFYYQLLS